MAYTAVISLKQTIQRFLNSSRISVVYSSREILDSAYKQLIPLQEVLRKSDDDSSCSKKILNSLEGVITEALHQFEDTLEFHFLSIEEEAVLEIDFNEVQQEIISFVEAVKKMEKDYNQELQNPNSSGDDDDHHAVPSTSNDSSGVKMVGLSDIFIDLKEHMTRILRPDDFVFISFYGMAGTGRSVVAKTVYDDIGKSFDCGAWVRIGPTYQLKQILLNLIAQTNFNEAIVSELQQLLQEEEEKLGEYLYTSLKGRRYIVVLDDIRDTEILIQLRRWLPEQNNGSLVFVTTSLMEVAEFDESFFVCEIPTLIDEDFIWDFIRLSMFSLDDDISEFEEAGKKIAKNCQGRGLVVARIMLLLLRSGKRRMPEFWHELAERESIFVVEDEISEMTQVKEYLRQDDEVWSQGLLDFSITITRIKSEFLYPNRLFPRMGIMSIRGMAGIGKTTLVKKLLNDPSISSRFNHCVWINAGSKYKPEQILKDILVQIDPNYIDQSDIGGAADQLATDLSTRLSDKKCLIVLDDLWSQEPVHYLKRFMPNIKGELVVTTRILKVGIFGNFDRMKTMRLLNEEESWDLLREKVFGEETCPYQLEKAGKKIVKKCEGLPLLILAVADLLSQSEITLEYWNEVAEEKKPVVMNAQIDLSKALVPSYESLPQHLKACFLYMGVSRLDHEISTSNLMNLWMAEGFLEPNPSQTLESFTSECLEELVDKTMVMVRHRGFDLKTKTCGLHSVFWHLSNFEATTSKFFHVLNKYDDDSMESLKSQRRLCIRNSILLGIKDVYDATTLFLTSRALLCTGPYHQYPMPLYFGSRLLRVLDALVVRFYEFPIEVVKLIHLRFLALTCDGELPASISKLWNLQFLIVRQHLSIKSSSNSSCLPKEIWDMKELKHIQITGSKLPSPDCGDLLPNLSSLLDVSVHSCTKRVFERMPNLKKLGIQVELAPNDDNSNPFHYLYHISCLSKLESFKCVVVNPDLGFEVVAPPIPPMLPLSLKKLSLSGLGFPWEYLSIIGKLQNLEVLKLRCYAFMGPAWEIDYHDFPRLEFLSIEDTDLVHLDIKIPSIVKLQSLSIKHCYNLEQLPSYLPIHVQKVEVVESHPLAENWAKEMKEKNWKRKMRTLEFDIQSLWNDENLKYDYFHRKGTWYEMEKRGRVFGARKDTSEEKGEVRIDQAARACSWMIEADFWRTGPEHVLGLLN